MADTRGERRERKERKRRQMNKANSSRTAVIQKAQARRQAARLAWLAKFGVEVEDTVRTVQ